MLSFINNTSYLLEINWSVDCASKYWVMDFFCANGWLFGLGVVSREMFDDLQNAEIISTLTKKFNEVRSKNHIWKLFVLLYRNDWCLNWVPGFSLFFIVNTLWDLFVQSCYFHLFSRILWAIHCPVQVPSSSALSLACVNLPSFWWTHVGIVSFTMSTSSLLCLRCSLACLTPRSGPSDTPAPCSVSTFMCSLNKVLPLLNFTVALNKMPNLVFEKFGSVKRKFPLHVFFLLAMKLMTGLVKVSLGVTIQLQTTQKRYDIECGKRVPDRASDRLEELKASINEVTHHFSYTPL